MKREPSGRTQLRPPTLLYFIYIFKTRKLDENPIDRWMKGCIIPFLKRGDLGLARNYRGITLTSIAAKIYNVLQRNRIEPKIDNIARTKIASGEIDSRRHKFLLSVEFLKVNMQKFCTNNIICRLWLFDYLTPFTEERWTKFYSLTAYQKNMSLP